MVAQLLTITEKQGDPVQTETRCFHGNLNSIQSMRDRKGT
jgi:hypothetical protein